VQKEEEGKERRKKKKKKQKTNASGASEKKKEEVIRENPASRGAHRPPNHRQMLPGHRIIGRRSCPP
jgi:hypothetical protein